jgi:hypothetical protein
MKRIIFLENEGDYKSSLAYLDKNRSALEEYVVVNLNSDLDFDYSGFKALSYRTEADYVDDNIFSGINEEGFRFASQWFDLKEAKPLLTYEDINMGFVMEHFFTRAVITALKYLRLLKKIILEEKCDEVIIVKHNVLTEEIKDIVPQSHDKAVNDIILCLKSDLDIKIKEINNPFSQETKKPSRRIEAKDIVCVLIDPLRHLLNFFTRFYKKGLKRVVMVGTPRLIFPIMDDAQGKKEYKYVYFQKRLAPRMFFNMLKRFTPYKVESDYRTKSERKILADYETKLQENRQQLLKSEEVRRFFEFDGISFFRAVRGRIDFAFRDFIPEILKQVIRFKGFIKKEKIDFMVIDEDLKQFSRPLILCMNLAGVKSLELLHGLYGYFHTASLITTKKAVWGECLKRYFAEAGRIPAEALIPTGCPILDALPGRDKQIDIKKVRKDFGINKGHKVILFPSRPFKRGAKGGMVGIHIDRIKYENMLASLIRTLKNFDNIHLIIKMHHNDSSGDYNRNIMAREGYDKPFSIVQDYDIYSLLSAADLLVTPASTTIVEAIVMDKPVVMLNYRREEGSYPFAAWGAVKGVDKHEDLKGAMEELLNSYDPEQFKEARKTTLEDLVCGADGKATSRIIETMSALIGEKSYKTF